MSICGMNLLETKILNACVNQLNIATIKFCDLVILTVILGDFPLGNPILLVPDHEIPKIHTKFCSFTVSHSVNKCLQGFTYVA